MKTVLRLLLLLFVPASIISGCSSSPGPDALSSRKPQTAGTLLDCAGCHSAATLTRRQIYGAGGDFGANNGLVSHHIAGASDPSADQCQVCHDQSTHMSGTIRLWNADTGASIVYNPASPAGVEQFCLSCHDANGAASTFVAGGSPLNPFNDGSVLGQPPYPYAARIASSWAKSYGHGPNGQHDANKKLTCLGTGQPGTGCHGSGGSVNAHGSANQVLSASGFNYDIGGTYAESDYALCFSCHANYPGFTKEDTLGVRWGGILDTDYGYITGPRGLNPPYEPLAGRVTTLFADHNDPLGSPYNDPAFWGPTEMNLHWFHAGLPVTIVRGDDARSGRLICVNCHDVHGSSTPYGAVYDEMGYDHDCSAGSDLCGQMSVDAYNTGLLAGYPTYCAFNCHPVQGQTRAWYFPITE